MGQRDSNIDWLRKSLMIYYYGSNGIFETTDTIGSGIDAAVFPSELGSLGFSPIIMTAGDQLPIMVRVPKDVDPQFPIGYRVHWTALHDNDGDAAATFTLLTRVCKKGVAIAAAAAALDTVLVSDNYVNDSGVQSVTDHLYQITARGIDNSLGITRKDIETGALLLLYLESTTIDADITTLYLIGLEMDYVPWKTEGQGSNYYRPELHTGVK